MQLHCRMLSHEVTRKATGLSQLKFEKGFAPTHLLIETLLIETTHHLQIRRQNHHHQNHQTRHQIPPHSTPSIFFCTF